MDTTKQFQKRYPWIYQNFYQNQEKVISFPIFNKWSSYLQKSEQGIHLLSTLNLRIYIAFQKKIENKKEYLIYFDGHDTWKKETQKLIQHPQRNINILLETHPSMVDYRDDIKKQIQTIVIYQFNKQKFLRFSKTFMTKIFQKEKIGYHIIYKKKNQETIQRFNDIYPQKEQLRRQLFFYKKEINKKLENSNKIKEIFPVNTHFKTDYEYYNAWRQQLQNTKNFVSQHIVEAWIQAKQGEKIENIFRNFRHQQLLLKSEITLHTNIHHAIIQNNNKIFSVLIPRYLSQIAEQELIKNIEKTQKSKFLCSHNEGFQDYPWYQEIQIHTDDYRNKQKNTNNFFLETNQGERIFNTRKIWNTIKNYDIILNTIENKIYLQGKKLNSSEIHSQIMTIELLLQLIKKTENIIHNKELQPSTYSKNKNDMNSKIILPLKKIIKKKEITIVLDKILKIIK